MDRDNAEELDLCRALNWLFDVHANPHEAFDKYTDDEWKELASDTIILLRKRTKIVYCKYCKHCDTERLDKNMVWCNLHEFARPENYYCADGK